MKLGIMQPYFFPYIGYWQLINAVDKFVIYDDVNYIKQGWINRNSILINNQMSFVTLSLSKASSNNLINEILVINNSKKLIKTIEMNYKKAPFFSETMTMVELILNNDEVNLALFVGSSINIISNYLGINTELIYSSSINKNNNLKGQDKVIHMCKKLKAKEYLNAIGGQSLYTRDCFTKKGLELRFVESLPIEYKQFNDSFIPNLSIIDVMMFNSVEKIQDYLQKYKLI